MNAVTILLGPTASGKTAVSLPLAERLGAEILCLDSRQIFRDMAIGTAQPEPSEQARVPHHLFGVVDPSSRMSAGDYGRLARTKLAELDARGVPALFVGGSGLYLKGLLGELADGLPHDEAVRQAFRDRARNEGAEALHAELAARDPATAARLHPNDLQRVTRALEVIALTGRAVGDLFMDGAEHGRSAELRARTRIAVLSRPRETLYARINARTRELLDGGMIEEVKRHLDRGLDVTLPVFRAHGYPEIAAYLAGSMTLDAVEARIAQVTRNYAKRQETWFRKMEGVLRVEISDGEPPEVTAERVALGLITAGAPPAAT